MPERGDGSRSRSPVRREASPEKRRSPPPREERDRSRSRSRPRRERSRTPPREVRRRSPSRSRSRDRDRRRSRSPGYDRDRRRSRSPRRNSRSPPRRPRSPPRPGCQLFVAGFNFMCNEKDVIRKFGRYGDVRDVRLVRGPNGESRGFGFVDYNSEDDAKAAIRGLDQTEWNGRRLLVEVAKRPRTY